MHYERALQINWFEKEALSVSLYIKGQVAATCPIQRF